MPVAWVFTSHAHRVDLLVLSGTVVCEGCLVPVCGVPVPCVYVRVPRVGMLGAVVLHPLAAGLCAGLVAGVRVCLCWGLCLLAGFSAFGELPSSVCSPCWPCSCRQLLSADLVSEKI